MSAKPLSAVARRCLRVLETEAFGTQVQIPEYAPPRVSRRGCKHLTRLFSTPASPRALLISHPSRSLTYFCITSHAHYYGLFTVFALVRDQDVTDAYS